MWTCFMWWTRPRKWMRSSQNITAIRNCNGAMGRKLFFCLALLACGTSRALPTFIDLSKAANMGPADSFDGVVAGGEDLKEKEGFTNIPQGPQTFRGIPFQLLDGTQNQGKSFVVLKGKRKPAFPEAVALSAGHLKANTLYFLHSCR